MTRGKVINCGVLVPKFLCSRKVLMFPSKIWLLRIGTKWWQLKNTNKLPQLLLQSGATSQALKASQQRQNEQASYVLRIKLAKKSFSATYSLGGGHRATTAATAVQVSQATPAYDASSLPRHWPLVWRGQQPTCWALTTGGDWRAKPQKGNSRV